MTSKYNRKFHIYVRERDWPVIPFLNWILSSFGVRVLLDKIEVYGRTLKGCINVVIFFLKYLVEFTNEAIWALGFLCGMVLNYNFTVFSTYRTQRFSISFCVDFGK